MTGGKIFVELESVINLNKPMHLSFKNKRTKKKQTKNPQKIQTKTNIFIWQPLLEAQSHITCSDYLLQSNQSFH